jgi:diguanylate cyclase (GGDEF)-like protein
MDDPCLNAPEPPASPPEPDALLTTVNGLQEMVASRAPLPSVYQAVIDGVTALLGTEIASLRFRDRADPQWTTAVATRPTLVKESWHARAPISEGVSGRAISHGELVVVADLQPAMHGSRIAPATQRAAMAAPLFEGELIVGSLLVACNFKRDWKPSEQALLRDYARHTSALLARARAADAVEQAFTDSLTGLGNRAFLLDRLQHELGRADRARRLVTVLFVDLDRFKTVNDSLGHHVGDQLLIAVAQRLRGCVRVEDACARLGGDEFAVLLGDGGEPALIADRIIAALGERFEIADHDISISASVGIASGREEAETVLRKADLAMYAAKRRGAARYERFEPRMRDPGVSRRDLDIELRHAIERDELDARYQPIVDLRSGNIVAFEALVSWQHPPSAAELVPIAEGTGLAVDLARWRLERAAADLGSHGVAISLNVSMRELADPRFLAAVHSTTAGALPPSAVILELSANEKLTATLDALANLDALKALGVRVALDDFGTGRTSLEELTTLPLDLLKIAAPFMPGDPARARTSALLPMIVAIAGRLELETVAQGLDRPEQIPMLRDLGCSLGQGALHGAAVDASTAQILLGLRPRT